MAAASGSLPRHGRATPSSTTGSPAIALPALRRGRPSTSARTWSRALAQTDPDEPVLIDGFTLWLSTLLGDDAAAIDPILDGPVAAALTAIAARPGPVVVVSDEVGSGIVPMHAGARAYRDLVGIAHQRLAELADEVYLLVAGLPIALKGGPR